MENSDLISREAARDVINMWRQLTLLHNDLNAIPAIDAEPVRRGRWVKMTGMMPPEFHGHYECSECGWHLSGVRQTKNREEEFAYCPCCGAKMLECNADEKK